MNHPPTSPPARILVIGRSPSVILEAADILRSKGFHADATNQFDDVLTEYDTANLDVVVFGGMVAPHTKQHLRNEISRVNGHAVFVQGLAGIAGLIAAQVEGVTAVAGDERRGLRPEEREHCELTVREPAQVVVEAWWTTSFTPPEPTSTSMRVVDTPCEAGEYVIPLPAEVPSVASFVTVSVGPAVHIFTVGAMPDAVTRHRADARPDPASRAPHRPSRGDPLHALTVRSPPSAGQAGARRSSISWRSAPQGLAWPDGASRARSRRP